MTRPSGCRPSLGRETCNRDPSVEQSYRVRLSTRAKVLAPSSGTALARIGQFSPCPWRLQGRLDRLRLEVGCCLDAERYSDAVCSAPASVRPPTQHGIDSLPLKAVACRPACDSFTAREKILFHLLGGAQSVLRSNMVAKCFLHVVKLSQMKNNLQDKQIGSRLREERRRLGLNQTQVAGIAGVSLTSQSHYESATHRPDSAYLSQVAGAGIDILYVLTGTRQGELNPNTIDWLAVNEIADLVAKWAVQRPEPPSPELRAHFLRVFYEQYLAQKKISPGDYLTTLAHIA